MHSQQLAQDIHVWRVDIERPAAIVDRLVECLSPDERQRAERFLREADSRRFIVSHAALRTILGQYLGVSAAGVEFTVSSTGKPELAHSSHHRGQIGDSACGGADIPVCPTNHNDESRQECLPHRSENCGLAPRQIETALRFNLSHSDEIALVAVALDREVGVDVERVRPLGDMEHIVKRYFAAGEQHAWRALPDGERIAGFFRCWTRKEAYLKARGVGLSLGLDQFEVSLAADEPVGVVRDGDANSAATQWSFYDISSSDGYMAACVTRPRVTTVRAFDWPSPAASVP